MIKTPDTTLIVMNMAPVHIRYISEFSQYAFLSEANLEINDAIAQKAGVLVQNCIDSSVSDELNTTIEPVTDALRRHRRKHFISTQSSNASEEILAACEEFGFSTSHIQLIGAFTNLSIRDNAVSLAKLLPTSNIEVLRLACISTNPDDETCESFWNRFSEPNILISPQPFIRPWSTTDVIRLPNRKVLDYNRRPYGEIISM